MAFSYRPGGVCSRKMEFELDDENRIVSLQIEGGCSGNLQGIVALVQGLKASDVIKRLGGIRCGGKPTSCPDQLSQALIRALQMREQAEEGDVTFE